MVNIKAVANQAKVSTATVSRVLNGNPRCSEETRRKVQQAAKELGYHPNSIAKSLRIQRAGTIITVLNDIRNPVFSDMIKGMEDVAYRSDYSLLIGNTDNSQEREDRYLHDFLSRKADGIILVTPRVSEERILALREMMPVVLINDPRRMAEVPVIGIDDYAAMREITQHMLLLGHRRFAFIGGDDMAGIARRRRQAFLDCMQAQGIQDTPMLSTGVTMQHGMDALSILLAQGGALPSAIVCYNDEVAIGVMHCAREHGIAIPDALSVCGFDDISTAQIVYPSLTTVHQPTYQIGEMAATVLLNLLTGDSPTMQTVFLPHTLRIRNSAVHVVRQ